MATPVRVVAVGMVRRGQIWRVLVIGVDWMLGIRARMENRMTCRFPVRKTLCVAAEDVWLGAVERKHLWVGD